MTRSNQTRTVTRQSGALVRLYERSQVGWRKVATGVAALLALSMGYHVIFGQNGLTVYQQKRQDAQSVERQLHSLQRENDLLKGHGERLKRQPIALVTSMNEDGGLNAAPFSSYNYLCTDPPIIGMGVTNRPNAGFVPKDTARNIRRTGEFVVNVVTEDLMPKMNICATDFPAEMNELEMAGLSTAPSQ